MAQHENDLIMNSLQTSSLLASDEQQHKQVTATLKKKLKTTYDSKKSKNES